MILLSQDNTILEIETKYPLIGITFLVCFLEGKHKEQLSKQFKFSYDNNVWSEWLELSRTNINELDVNNKHKLFIQFKFENGELIEDGLSFQLDDNFYTTTVFSKYFKSFNLRTMQWVENILEKFLIKSGTLANFIDRQNDTKFEDFIVFWFSILKYFSYYEKLANMFSNFSEVSVLLSEYLSQKELILQGSESLSDLQSLEKTFYHQMMKRGTINILQESDDQGLKGEFLRLIKKEDNTEFLYNIYPQQYSGWSLGNNSPLYRGLLSQKGFNKLWSIEETPIINPENVEIIQNEFIITSKLYSDEEFENSHFDYSLRFPFLGQEGGGIGGDPSKPILVDHRMDYVLSLDIEVIEKIGLDIQIQGYDEDLQPITLLSHKDDSGNTGVLNDITIKRSINIKIGVYNSEKPSYINDVLNIGVGNNLKLTNKIKYIVPKIMINKGACILKNVTLVPMFTNYMRGFLNTKSISIIGENKSELNQTELVQKTSDTLLPLGMRLLFTNIGDYIYKENH